MRGRKKYSPDSFARLITSLPTNPPPTAATIAPSVPTAVPQPAAHQFSWIGPKPLGGTTDVSMFVVTFNNTLYLFGKGIDDKQIYM